MPSLPRHDLAIPLAPDDPDGRVESTFNAIRRLVNVLHASSRETQRQQGVTAAQLFVLSELRDSPALSISALAARTMTHQSTVSVVVARLVRRKLVKKRRAAVDARRVELSLTPAGEKLLKHAPVAFQVRLREVISSLAARDRESLDIALHRLLTGLGVDDVPPGMFFETIEAAS